MNITKNSFQLYNTRQSTSRMMVLAPKGKRRELVKLDEQGQTSALSYDDLRTFDANGDGLVGSDEFVSANLGLSSEYGVDDFVSFNEYAKKTGASYSISLHSGYMSGEVPTENTPKPSVKEKMKVAGTALLAGGMGLGMALLMSSIFPPLGPVAGPVTMAICTAWPALQESSDTMAKIPSFNPEDHAVLPPADKK